LPYPVSERLHFSFFFLFSFEKGILVHLV
jgi:hypothetical protein